MNLFLKEVNYLSFSYSYLLTFLNKIFQGYGSNLSFNQNTEKQRLSYLKIKPKKTLWQWAEFLWPTNSKHCLAFRLIKSAYAQG